MRQGIGIAFPVAAVVILKLVGKAVLILVPLTLSGARLHSHTVDTPADVTREVNRCLTFVRVAASRRGAEGPERIKRERRPHAGSSPRG